MHLASPSAMRSTVACSSMVFRLSAGIQSDKFRRWKPLSSLEPKPRRPPVFVHQGYLTNKACLPYGSEPDRGTQKVTLLYPGQPLASRENGPPLSSRRAVAVSNILSI